jgi:hypothetical protein
VPNARPDRTGQIAAKQAGGQIVSLAETVVKITAELVRRRERKGYGSVMAGYIRTSGVRSQVGARLRRAAAAVSRPTPMAGAPFQVDGGLVVKANSLSLAGSRFQKDGLFVDYAISNRPVRTQRRIGRAERPKPVWPISRLSGITQMRLKNSVEHHTR